MRAPQRELLLTWFRENGRDLPWRRTTARNVRRVQGRTGMTFDPECAQALMDLGATICLARVPRCGACPVAAACPSRGRRYEPLRRQSRFEGSFRQRRAATLRLVTERARPL